MGEVIAVSHIDKQIILMMAEGLPYKQICDKTGITEDGIKKRVARLKEKFRCASTLHLYKTMKEGGYI